MKRKQATSDLHSTRGSLRLWVALAVVFLMLIFAIMGQFDLALAAFIGLVLGNGLKALFRL